MSPGSNNGRQRPRSRGFSFNSNKSGGSRPKSEFETPEEKQRRDSIWKNQSKSNPNAAMTEAQPGGAYLHTILYPSRPSSYRHHHHPTAFVLPYFSRITLLLAYIIRSSHCLLRDGRTSGASSRQQAGSC